MKKEYLVSIVYHKCDVYETYLVEAFSEDAIELHPNWVDQVLGGEFVEEDIEFGEGPHIVQIQENS